MKNLLKPIYTSPGFQYSVNAHYDLENGAKVTNYIPIAQNTNIIKDVVYSFENEVSSRSHLIVGNYGTGKSHLCTVLLSILAKKQPLDSYSSLLDKIRKYDSKGASVIEQELQRDPILPVVVSDSGQNFEQILLGGLHNALVREGLSELMPKTAYSAAIDQIDEWERKYPQANDAMEEYLKHNQLTKNEVVEGLRQYDKSIYDIFSSGYTHVSHGAVFEPILRSNVEEAFVEVARLLPMANHPQKKFRGIIVLFDEFGKYLENAWDSHKNVNLKPLQDFAEACNSSGDYPVNLVLVTHKPISQYASKYGQELINEWKKVEGRFKSIELTNQATKVYEIISNVILKDKDFWNSFKAEHEEKFDELSKQLFNSRLFSDLTIEEFNQYVMEGSYPLHPVTTYVLPRFSQKVAQNERTVFTFLCTGEFNTLGEFLRNNNLEEWNLLTLDVLYDYFEIQLQSLNSDDSLYQIYVQARSALNSLNESDIYEARIIKALSVIKAIGIYSVLPPTLEILKLCFGVSDFHILDMVQAFNNLLSKRILFEGRATGNIEIIQPGEIDVEKEVTSLIVKRKSTLDQRKILNEILPQKYVLAKRYNDEYHMTRYFSCCFISANEILKKKLSLKYDEDGRIYYALAKDEEEVDVIREFLQKEDLERQIFILPKAINDKESQKLDELVQRLDSLQALYDSVIEKVHVEADQIELSLRIKDTEYHIKKILSDIYSFRNAKVLYQGSDIPIRSTSDLSRFVSKLCSTYFDKTPKLNNEMINKHLLTKPIIKARQKVVDGLLANYLQPNLGIEGSGPELSIYKSLIRIKGLLVEDEESIRLQKISSLKDRGLIDVLADLKDMIFQSYEGISFQTLLRMLCAPPYGIRKGVIPVLLGIVLHGQNREIMLLDSQGKEVLINAENIDQAMSMDEDYKLSKVDWSEENLLFCQRLKEIFSEYLDREEDLTLPTKEIADAVRRWFLSIPRFTRDSKGLSKEAKNFRKILKQDGITSTELIFTEIPKALGYQSLTLNQVSLIADKLNMVKEDIDSYLHSTLLNLEQQLMSHVEIEGSTTLLAASKKWYSNLSLAKKEHLYSNLTQDLLDLISSYNGENSQDFLIQVCTTLVGLRPEDWNDQTVKAIPSLLKDIIEEVNSSKVLGITEESYEVDNIVIMLPQSDGNSLRRVMSKGEVSTTGNHLQNLLWSYIRDYGDAISKNEKRQIVINLLEKLISDRS